MTKRTPMPPETDAQKTDLPLPVERELQRLVRARRGKFLLPDIARDLQAFLRAAPGLVDELDPGGPPPDAAGYEGRLAGIAQHAVDAWDRANAVSIENSMYLPAPPWIRAMAAVFETAREAPEDQAAIAAIDVAVEAEARRSGMRGDTVLELYRVWVERRHALMTRVHAYELDVHALIDDAWLRHPKGKRAKLREVLASGLVDVEAIRAAVRRHGLAPAPGWTSLWPGKWMLAEDASAADAGQED